MIGRLGRIGGLTAVYAASRGLSQWRTHMTGRTTARAARLAVALLASIALVAVAAATAGAATTKTPFQASYEFTGLTGGGYGAVHCVGTRQVSPSFAKKGWPTATRDVQICTSTDPSGKLIGLTGGEEGTWFPGANGWTSDYDATPAVTAAYKVSLSDKKFKIVAYY
jgi:hypothetical protein